MHTLFFDCSHIAGLPHVPTWLVSILLPAWCSEENTASVCVWATVWSSLLFDFVPQQTTYAFNWRVQWEWPIGRGSTQVEKEMVTHSSTLAWRIPGTEETGGLLSMGSHKVRHGWSNLACMHALEKEMATHSGVLVWRIPGTEEPGGLPSVGLYGIRHDWSDLAAAAALKY